LLKEKGFDLRGFFYNPNIHPYTEYKLRRDCLISYAQDIGLPVMLDDHYDLIEFLRSLSGFEEEGTRCRICYNIRLERTARAAVDGGFDLFSTTLLISPYQKHEILREVGEEVSRQYQIPFYYEDLRPGWQESRRMAKALGLYRQRYCGCIYSEAESQKIKLTV